MEVVQRASKMARVLFAVLAILLLIATLFSSRFFDWAGRWLAEEPSQTLQRFDVFIGWIFIFSLPILVGGFIMYMNGRRSVTSERFPPVGMCVLVDTPVETGSRAKLRGRFLQLAGFLICVVAVGFPVALWFVVRSIAEPTF